MDLTYKDLENIYEYPSEITDEQVLRNFRTFYNDLSKKEEYNYCLDLKVEDKCYMGSDTQFEEILTMFPNHRFKQVKSENKYLTCYEGYLESEQDDYFILEYSGGYPSKFDLVRVTLKGSKEAFELIKNKYNLV